jgi:leader peptidase (prepilin peptidase)/N-methyltransferase
MAIPTDPTAPIFWALALAGLGAIIGSFLGALVVRWPAGRSIITGRSRCDACGHPVRGRDLIPILSALRLRGRCRDCAAPIAPVHGMMEGGAALIGGIAGAVAASPVALAGAMFGWLLLALAMLDARHFWLPDRLTGTLAVAGIVAGMTGVAPSPEDRAIGGVAGFALLWAIGEGYRRVRGRVGLGGGDPKLFGAIGLWLGWRMLPPVLLIASVVGLGLALFLAWRGRTMRGDGALPLGTCLAVAAYPTWLAMIAWVP